MTDHSHRLVAARVLLIIFALIASPGSIAAGAPQPTQVEPGAGGSPTWLLDSGGELRPQAAPAEAATQTELASVQDVAAQRDQAMLDRISYWDAGAPSYRWIQRSVKYMQDHGVAGNRAGRLLGLMTVAMYDATIAAWDAKYAFNRARPSGRDPSLAAVTPPASPSYPEERAVAAGAASTVLTYAFPMDADLFITWAAEATRSRVEAGVAYPSDSADGWRSATGLARRQLIGVAPMDPTRSGPAASQPSPVSGPARTRLSPLQVRGNHGR